MGRRFSVSEHRDSEELAARYRATRDPIERGRWQMIWLPVAGRSLREVADVTGYSSRWAREVVRRYNAHGPEGLADRRHANPGAAPLLDADGRQALETALERPPPEGGRWTCAKVAAWIAGGVGAPAAMHPVGAPAPNGIAARLGREKVPAQRGGVYLRRTGHSRQVPRPQHVRAADPAAQAAFQKG